ncbi:MAG: GAF domain-containing protein [Chloroflexi bacterium]|nr:GAF domain-containing protein [Chloroflexota bacterium]
MSRLSLLQRFSIISLVLFIVIGALLGWGLTDYLQRQAIEQEKNTVAFLMPPVAGPFLTANILANGICARGLTPEACSASKAYKTFDSALGTLGGSGLVRVKLWNKDGMVIYSDDAKLVGRNFPITDELAAAFSGQVVGDISDLTKTENVDERGYGGFTELLEVYTPLQLPGQNGISGAYEGYFDIGDLRDGLTITSEYLWTSIAFGFLFLYISLFTIVRTASQRILRQRRENAALLIDTQRKADRLEVLNQLARSINSSSLNLNRVFQTALHGIERIVKHSGASISLYDEEIGELSNTVFSQPITGSENAMARLDSKELEAELEMLGSADTFICDDTRLATAPALIFLAERGVFSLLLVSIRLGDRQLGVLALGSDLPHAFNEEEAQILKGVADQLAVAIENVRLIKETAETTALRETNRLKDDFVSMVSHELRTPLASIKGYSRTLMGDDGHWDEQTRDEFLSIIADESDKLTDLVENLLEMSRIDAGRLPIVPEPILLWHFCKGVVERVSKHYPQMKFDCELGEGLPMVQADPRRVEQVVVNLLQNAAKYSGADVISVTGAYSGGQHAIISVVDNGIGIAPEYLPHLFDKFYRVDNGQGDSGVGTGLGLAIAKALVEAQGGRIWVESKPCAGATFAFTLPILALDSEESGLQNSDKAPVDKLPVT